MLSLQLRGVRDGVAFAHRYSFDVVSGLPIGLPDLFSPDGYGRLRAKAAGAPVVLGSATPLTPQITTFTAKDSTHVASPAVNTVTLTFAMTRLPAGASSTFTRKCSISTS